MSHHHEHSHYHIHTNEKSTRIVVFLSFITMLAELYVGYSVNSKTLVMDGWHMLSHVLILLLSWAAYYYIRKQKDKLSHARQHRIISMAGFASAIIMLIITLLMVKESIEKFFSKDVDVTNEALLVAVIGLMVNGISAWFLHREEEQRDVNLYAAYLHVLSDMIISSFAIAALLVARYWDMLLVDSILALVAAAVILKWSIALIQKSWREVLNG